VDAPPGTDTAQRRKTPAAASSGGDLLGREGLIGEVTGVIQAARRSQGGAVVLRGPAGIGKSSLLAVARSAGTVAGMRVLAAKGARNESGLAFAGLHQLIRPLLGELAQLPGEQAELLRSAFGDSRAGADRFGTLGIVGWSARARAELEATGEASQESRPGAWSRLTPQEWQIAQLAAAGMTNGEIGEQLLISRRTVGSHLYHLFPKLGVTARSQLADALCAAEPTAGHRQA